MSGLSKAEYLKKYLSGTDQTEKKKKKKRKIPTAGVLALPSSVKIFDNDIDINALVPDNVGNTLDEDTYDDNPTVAAMVDERPDDVQQLEKFRQDSRWKLLTSEEKQELRESKSARNASQKNNETKHRKGRTRHDSDSDNSPVRTSKRNDSDSDQSPVRTSKKRHDSDSDQSPARTSNKRHDSDSDQSPVRTSNKRHGSDSDQSPVRNSKRHDSSSDQSPPRRSNKGSKSQSPKRSKRHKQSQAYDSDQSPQRSRDPGSDSDQSPKRRSKHGHSDSDQSPPRKNSKRGSDSDQSPVRKQSRRSRDLSPTRSGSSKSKLKRRSRFESPEPKKKSRHDIDDGKKMTKTLSGAKAGLSNAKMLREETERLNRKEKETFDKIGEDRLGRNAKTVFRDKSGKRRDFDAEEAEESEKAKKEAAKAAKYEHWGKGVAQSAQQERNVEEAVHEMSKPLARYSDDADRDDYLRAQAREGDPMAAFLSKKQSKHGAKKKELPKYKGPEPPPNRFNIRPGYRWDGVNRSNGFEKKLFAAGTKRIAIAEEAYKWSVENM